MTDLSSQQPIEGLQSRPWTGARNPDRRCTAHKKTGERCTKVAIVGGTVCPSHGGKARQVRARTQQRIQEAADRMVLRVLGIADSEDVPPAVALAAARDMLDRAGHRPADKVEVGVEVKPYERILGQVTGMATMTREESRALRAGQPALSSGQFEPDDVIEAEVVEEPAGGWPDEAHDPTEHEPARGMHDIAGTGGVTGPSDGPPSAMGLAGEALSALAVMTDEERAIRDKTERRGALRDRQSEKDDAVWEADNKSRQAAGEVDTEVRHHSPAPISDRRNITHTREQVAAEMRLQRGVKPTPNTRLRRK
ncbi:hypothetical protein [Mycobacterium sp. URHB0021]